MTSKKQFEEARGKSEKGLDLLEQGDIAKGLLFLFKAAGEVSGDPCILNNLAVGYLYRKDYWSALKFFLHSYNAFCGNSENKIKHPESLLEILKKIDLAVQLMENEGVAHLRAKGPDGVDGPAGAAVFFERALQFAPSKLTLRRWYITALETQGCKTRAFVHAKNLAVELVATAISDMGALNLERLNLALRVYLPNQTEMLYATAKELLPAFVAAERVEEIDFKRLKRILNIFLPLPNA